jgi:D-amino-acid dehydrogenase
MSRQRILVIGGGVIGVCAAYYLARDGWSVTLADKAGLCAGCSYGNAGLLVPSHSVPLPAPGVPLKGLKWMLNPESPFYIKPRPDRDLLTWLWAFRSACNARQVRQSMPVLRDLSYASLALYRELAAIDRFDFGFTERGVLMTFVTERGFDEGVAESRLLEDVGITAKLLDRRAARALEPALSSHVVGATYFPDDAHLSPDRFVKGLARIAEQMGVEIRLDTEVLGFRTAGRRIESVETTKGPLNVDEVVLAAGSWSAALAADVGLRLPIQPAKGYSITYKLSPRGPNIPLLLGEAKVGVTPIGDTLRFAGTLEFVGLDLSVNRRRVEAIRRSASRYLEAIGDLDILEIWRGLRPCTPDGVPIIGRAGRLENLIVATGHAMIGVSLGPVTGRLVSEIASGRRPSVDLGPLSPERFSRR